MVLLSPQSRTLMKSTKKTVRSPRRLARSGRPTTPRPARRTSPAHSPPHADARPAIPDEFTHASRGARLQKILAQAGVASRRECETLITTGHVTINGKLVRALPAWADAQRDQIHVDGRPIHKPTRPNRPSDKVVIALHKPRRVVSTTNDPQGRPCVTDLIQPPLPRAPRLYPIGRLDADSTGLILLTNDGDLAHHLMHPSFGVAKQYVVTIKGHLSHEHLEDLRKGLYLAQKKSSPPAEKRNSLTKNTTTRNRGDSPSSAKSEGRSEEKSGGKSGGRGKRATMEQVRLIKYEQDRSRGDRTKLAVTLKEGQNRQIRRMLARLGYKVRRLQRVSIGPVSIKGLASGQWRVLSSRETQRLRQSSH